MKILFLSYHTSPFAERPGNNDSGGLNVYIKNVIKNLDNQNVEISVLTGEESESFKDRNISFTSFSLFKESATIGEKTLLLPKFIDHVIQFIKVNQVDIVHAHYWLSGLAAKEIKSQFGIPYLYTAHSYGKFIEEKSERINNENAILTYADLITASSEFEYNYLKQNYKTPDHKLKLLTPGVDTELFNVKTKNIRDNILLSVGRIQPQKGQLNVLLLFNKLLTLFPDLKLIFVGGPSGVEGEKYLKTIESEIELKGLKNNVHFMNSTTHEELINVYNKAKIVVHSSQFETFGLVTLEANASGVPVVSINQGPLREIIVNGQNGFVADTFEDENLLQFCKTLLSDNDYLSQIELNCIQLAKKYEWKNTVKELKGIYQELIFD